MCSIFGDPRSRDRELRHKKAQNGDVWLGKVLIRL